MAMQSAPEVGLPTSDFLVIFMLPVLAIVLDLARSGK
jgi:hypothetical protein